MSRNHILKPIVWIACLSQLGDLVWRGLRNDLGANPIERITHETGWWTLFLLVISLSITPLRRLTKQYWLIQYRRLIGLFAFFYATLHLLTYLWLDQFFNVPAILHDIAKRLFITVGMLSWFTMLPLALTSTQWSIRKLGKNWQRLHRLAYVSAFAGVVHFYWLVKRDHSEPQMFANVLFLLFGIRLVFTLLDRRKAAKGAAPRESVSVV